MSGRVLGVFVGGAAGAGNPKLAVIYLQVSFVVVGGLSLIVIVAWNLTKQVWEATPKRVPWRDIIQVS
jgi:hypothetical protein